MCEDISMCRNTKLSVCVSVHLSRPGSCPFFKQVLAARLVLSPEVTVSQETQTGITPHHITPHHTTPSPPPALPPVSHHLSQIFCLRLSSAQPLPPVSCICDFLASCKEGGDSNPDVVVVMITSDQTGGTSHLVYHQPKPTSRSQSELW